ncbi:hypothetical protein CNBK1770 [Cryptococcus deneoformans B-3501A]|uniref:hypothetical protein n=1 Tax=Cryptococcus deneoformans (strain B-3501A) TaxID=283643 RepID=UPI0000430246|nr:hypothetical protein CNBK1770 [Cryptococcus neoformans var. neoformans B-3501A]EAL18156.1 hypothetical protein CNBK1770 [Cryptococcus neoformans var. neoformans B-3501A]
MIAERLFPCYASSTSSVASCPHSSDGRPQQSIVRVSLSSQISSRIIFHLPLPIPHQQSSLSPSSMSSDPLRVPTPMPQEDPSKESSRPSLRALIGQVLTITLIDGRIIKGYFTCVDKQCNVILNEAEEFRPRPASLIAKEQALLEGRPIEGKLAEESDEEKVWKNREKYWPKSEPFGGYATGWGGRSLSMVCMKKDDIAKIEVEKDVWKWIGGQW